MRYSHSYKRLSKGFTLIEVMIVVAIVAILAAIAYPSYLESVRKSKRAEARAQLLETVQYMQRFYSQNDRFDKAIDGTPISLPDSLARVPRQGPQTYSIGFAAGSLQRASFTLQAARSGSMISDRCGTLQINNAGRRQISDASPGVTVDECWR